jgi:hypothetical protein
MPESASAERTRIVVILAISGLLLIPPFFEQVLGLGSPWIRSWQMYHYAGTQLCWVDYSRVAMNGERIPLNRFTTLGKKDRWSAPSSIRWLRNEDDIRDVGKKMCKEIGDGTDIRVVAQCASARRWEDAFDGTERLCTPPAPPSPPDGAAKQKANKKQAKDLNKEKKPEEKDAKKKGKKKRPEAGDHGAKTNASGKNKTDGNGNNGGKNKADGNGNNGGKNKADGNGNNGGKNKADGNGNNGGKNKADGNGNNGGKNKADGNGNNSGKSVNPTPTKAGNKPLRPADVDLGGAR